MLNDVKVFNIREYLSAKLLTEFIVWNDLLHGKYVIISICPQLYFFDTLFS